VARKVTADDVRTAGDISVKPGQDYYQLVADKLNALIDPPRMIGRITLEGYGKSGRGGAAKIKVEDIPCWSDMDHRDPNSMAEAIMGDYGIVEIACVSFSTGFPSI
jgi:hypothetical protein